jgi:hypothetical protein
MCDLEDVKIYINDDEEPVILSPKTFHELSLIAFENNQTIQETIKKILVNMVEESKNIKE